MRQALGPIRGLMEASPTGRVPLGYYDDGLNLRDYDERAQRRRLASRPGLLRLGPGSPCPEGSAVLHSFTAKRTINRFRFAELSTTPQADVAPSTITVEEVAPYESKPLDSRIGPDDAVYALHSDGTVTRSGADGAAVKIFTVPIPNGFSLVPSLVVDILGGVLVAATNPLRIDGGASRVVRMREDELGSWIEAYEETVERTILRMWGSDGDVFASLQLPTNEESGPPFSFARYGGTVASAWSELWVRPSTTPVVDFDANSRAAYAVFAPSRSRPQFVGGNEASVDWTPRELDQAGQRLFSWISAGREITVGGYAEGEQLLQTSDARLDPSDFDPVVDDTARVMAQVVNGLAGTAAPRFERDPLGTTLEINWDGRYQDLYPNDDNVLPPLYASAANTANAEKATAESVVSAQRAILPSMGVAPALGARWSSVFYLRIENFSDAISSYTDWKVIFHQGGYLLRYRGEDDIELALDAPGQVDLFTTTISGNNARVMLGITCNGLGITDGSIIRLNGAAFGSVTINRAPDVVSNSTVTFAGASVQSPFHNQAFFGYAPFLLATQDDIVATRWKGGLKECITFLGRTGATPHDIAPSPAEMEEVEGYIAHRYGDQDILPVSHPYRNAPPVSAGGEQEPGVSPDLVYQQASGILARMERSSGRLTWAQVGRQAGGGVTVNEDGRVISVGRATLGDSPLSPEIAAFDDEGSTATEVFRFDTELADFTGDPFPQMDPCGSFYVPWVADGVSELRKFTGDGELVWAQPLDDAPTRVHRAGLYVDETFRDGPCSDERLFAVSHDASSISKLTLLGREDTRDVRDQEVQEFALCGSGVVARLVDGEYVQVVDDFTPGTRPWSFEFFGLHFFGGAEDYRVWDPERKQLRSWTPSSGSVIPERIFIAERWNGRVMAVSRDNRHILYGSAKDDAFDFRTGGEFLSATQAFAGTEASGGAVADPITALLVFSDDLLIVGTTRSVVRLTGDPQTGGAIDDVLSMEGIVSHWAQARGDGGELYWMTTQGRVVRYTVNGLQDISSDFIRGRLERIDIQASRVEMAWSSAEQGLYVMVIPREGAPQSDIEHLFWSRRTGGWHPVGFAGGAARMVTSLNVTQLPEAGYWGVAIGFADGGLRFVHREALDDDGVPIPTRVRLPQGGDGDSRGSLLTRAELVLAPDQGPVIVRGGAGRTGAGVDQFSPATTVMPGRGDRPAVDIAGRHTWLLLEGTGEQWAADDIAVNIFPWSAA